MRDLISIVIPVYNCENYLEECIKSLCSQTYKETEIICVDDGSTDSSPEILKKLAEKDSRIKILSQQNRGAGAARNYGLSVAKGKYIYFFDADDIAVNNLLELSYKRALETNADIVVFNGYTFTDDDINTKKTKPGYNKNVLGDSSCVFSWKDYPQNIMSIVNVVPWNKLIRTDFIKEKNIRFEEISSTNDITFSAVCAASAEKIALVDKQLMYYRLGHSGTISSTKSKNLKNIITAVESVITQASAFEYAQDIINAVRYFAVENYCFSFLNYLNNFSSENVQYFYNFIREKFNSDYFSDFSESDFTNKKLWHLFNSIKKHTYDDMLKIRSREIIVSFTSFPERIAVVPQIVESLVNQTKKADRIILNLAKSQFPDGKADLPQKLIEQINSGIIEIAWREEDLRSHKKYFYVMQENPESIVITVDDDLKYKPNLIDTLYYSYLCYPECVSAMRVHIVAVDNSKKNLFSYSLWPKECRNEMFAVSSQFFATSGAGTLYPPHSLDKRAFDNQKILELCPLADDVWLYFMQTINDTPCVSATDSPFITVLKECENQDTLFSENVLKGKNDIQINAVLDWLDSELGQNAVYNKIISDKSPSSFVGLENVFKFISSLQDEDKNTLKKLNKAYSDKTELNSKLKKTYKEKSERGEKIKSLQAEISKLETNKTELENNIKKLEKEKKELLPYKKYSKLSAYGIYIRLKKIFKRKH